MLSLDLLKKVAKRLDFHSTTILLLDFFDKDQTSLNITRLHSTPFDSLNKVAKRLDFFLDFFCRVKNRVKNRVVWPGPKTNKYLKFYLEMIFGLFMESDTTMLFFEIFAMFTEHYYYD